MQLAQQQLIGRAPGFAHTLAVGQMASPATLGRWALCSSHPSGPARQQSHAQQTEHKLHQTAFCTVAGVRKPSLVVLWLPQPLRASIITVAHTGIQSSALYGL